MVFVLEQMKGIAVMRCDKDYGFVKSMGAKDREEIIKCHNQLLAKAFSDRYNMVILDEFNVSYFYGLLDREMAGRFILDKEREAEIVLTGRNPDQVFLDAADYVSELCAVKHPYEKGMVARKGIEF